MDAVKNLNDKTRAITAEGREFSVGDLRQPLKIIARSYELRNVKGISSPYRQRPAHDPELQAKHDSLPAVQEMQNFVKKFRIEREV